MATTFRKDPDELLDYKFDWSDWLDQTDIIVSARGSAVPGITKSFEAFTTLDHTIWLGAGTVNNEYNITSSVMTQAGRTAKRTIIIRVENR